MNLETTRRELLAGIAALLSAPIKEVIPRDFGGSGETRKWLWVNSTGWLTPLGYANERTLWITAGRSDGQCFYVCVPMHKEDFIGPPDLVKQLVDLNMANAYCTLMDFLNCDCVVGKACARHCVKHDPEPYSEYDI